MKALKWIGLALLALVIVLAVSFVILLGPKDKLASVTQLVTIAPGVTRAKVAEQLAQDSIIKSSFAFFLYSRLIGGKILPGTYELSASFSGSDIAERLRDGKIKIAKITIIEGWRLSDIEKYLVEEKKLTQFIGLAGFAETDEGYLFPDTYEIAFDATIPQLVKLMKDNFSTRTKDLTVTPAAVILASIIEREAKTDEERLTIAGIYANRLKIGMRLEADPTVQYAKGSWKAVTTTDYRAVISPYNTYLNDGLPPGPICNPGLKSLEAALNPAKHNYYYFFQARGQLFLSKTFTEHAAKVRQYFN